MSGPYFGVLPVLTASQASGAPLPRPSASAETTADPAGPPNPQATRRMLIGLIFPAMLMPLMSTMSRVALPVIRADFGLTADVVAWVDASFTLPFMVLMPVYGRLSDGLGPRRLMMAGIALFAAGTASILAATGVPGLIAGRVVQGIGLAGMMPMGMALVASTFPPQARGRALGTWSTVGPTTGFIGPLIAGFVVAAWGWPGAYLPPLILSVVAFAAVYTTVTARATPAAPGFLRSFDWLGVGLLAAGLSSLVFFLSSRALTGVAPLQDGRLAVAAAVLLAAFVLWEKRRPQPFVRLGLLANGAFLKGSFCASMRMVAMGGIGILVPLYLTDIHHIRPAQLGGLLMIGAGSMALVVRLAGGLADRWSSRWFVLAGLALKTATMLAFWRFDTATPLIWVAVALASHGLGAGLMLATLHRAVMGGIKEAQMGAAAGLYNMLRFLGAVTGTALGGVFLQSYLDAGAAPVTAYQQTFLLLAVFPLAGAAVALTLRD